MNKRNKNIRKPMPPPTVAHDSWAQRAYDSFTPDQVQEGIEDWHADQADETWDWASPYERDQRLWEIK